MDRIAIANESVVKVEMQDMYIKQFELDKIVLERAEIDCKEDVRKEIKKALLVEVFELVNEMKSFKYWSTKKPNIEDLGMEIADVLHFAMSILTFSGTQYSTIHETIAWDAYKEVSIEELEEILISKAYSCYVGDSRMEVAIKAKHIIVLCYYIANHFELDAHELYCIKNKINIERQQNNY